MTYIPFMKLPLLLILLIFSLKTTPQSLREQLLKQDSNWKDIQLIPCKCDPDLFIALLITEPHWWEEIKIVKFKKGRIVWTAKFDTVPSSQAILSARQISLKGIPYPLFEVFDHTHQGNGYYYLYELRGKRAVEVAQTRAVDWSMDGSVDFDHHPDCSIIFKNDTLTPIYKDINNDGYTDIILKGTIQIVAADWKTILKQYPAQKVFIYNKREKRFTEDLKKRKGFLPEDD